MKTIDVYVDAPDNYNLLIDHIDNIKEFLLMPEAQALFPPPKNVRHNDWGSIQNDIESHYGPVHPLYGKCFHSAKFVYYFGGGKKYFDLKLIRPFQFCDLGYKTTHWFVKYKSNQHEFDASKAQFVYPGYTYDDLKDLWTNAKNGEFGNPYFNKKGPRFSEVVPNNTVLALGELYKQQYGTNGSIDWWYDKQNTIKEEKESLIEFFS